MNVMFTKEEETQKYSRIWWNIEKHKQKSHGSRIWRIIQRQCENSDRKCKNVYLKCEN